MKTQMSRFQIHDDLTAPEGSLPVLKGAMASGGQLPNFLGVLAGSPGRAARLRALPLRAAPRQPERATLERIALAVAEHYRRQPGSRSTRALRARPASASTRSPRARDWESDDPREAALLRYLRALRRAARSRRRCACTRRRARPAGATSSCSRRSPTSSLESLTAMVNVAGDVPVDGSVEDTRVLRAA